MRKLENEEMGKLENEEMRELENGKMRIVSLFNFAKGRSTTGN
ncbi:hypothetical protein [Capnocytophaga sp. oral taxon 864]|nr:hypothetical protein [Capnocytophaga sp. oral taxon 864]